MGSSVLECNQAIFLGEMMELPSIHKRSWYASENPKRTEKTNSNKKSLKEKVRLNKKNQGGSFKNIGWIGSFPQGRK